MDEKKPLTDQNVSPDGSAPVEPEGAEVLEGVDASTESELLEEELEELEELVIEDFTIDGICGVY